MSSFKINILDNGYIEYVKHWGSDEEIIESARMSTGKGFLGWEPSECEHCQGKGIVSCIQTIVDRYIKFEQFHGYDSDIGVIPGLEHDEIGYINCPICEGKGVITGDKKLLRYLFTKNHTTPFEMPGLTVEVYAPLFVFREWHRHRTQSYNEMSGRYVKLPDVDYIPSLERVMLSQIGNKQSSRVSGSIELTEENAREWIKDIQCLYTIINQLYRKGIDKGIPKELARIILPLARYSRMRASANLLNWLKFLKLRMPHDAMWEIRQYANAVGSMIADHFPKTWELFKETIEGK